MGQCENCGRWNMQESICDAFNEVPLICDFWISKNERNKIEEQIDLYKESRKTACNAITYIPLGGSCGKWVKGKTRLTNYGMV